MNSVPNALCHTAALAMLPPINCTMRCGSTGMMMPKLSMSVATVTKTKITAALRRCPGAISWLGIEVEGTEGRDARRMIRRKSVGMIALQRQSRNRSRERLLQAAFAAAAVASARPQDDRGGNIIDARDRAVAPAGSLHAADQHSCRA